MGGERRRSIFSITILFSAFPPAFSALGTALLAPFTVALLAIVLRSVALGLRPSVGPRTRAHILLGRLFGAASLVAPFAFGAVAGGLAKASSGPGPLAGTAPAIPWHSLFALVVGALAVALCAQLAASIVTLKLAVLGEDQITERFRRRALQSGACVLLLSVVALVAAAATAPSLWDRLSGAALPIVIAGLTTAVLSLLALALRWYVVARAATLATAAAILWGWFVAQAPHLIGRAPDGPHRRRHSSRPGRDRGLGRDRADSGASRHVPALFHLRPSRPGGSRMKAVLIPHVRPSSSSLRAP